MFPSLFLQWSWQRKVLPEATMNKSQSEECVGNDSSGHCMEVVIEVENAPRRNKLSLSKWRQQRKLLLELNTKSNVEETVVNKNSQEKVMSDIHAQQRNMGD